MGATRVLIVVVGALILVGCGTDETGPSGAAGRDMESPGARSAEGEQLTEDQSEDPLTNSTPARCAERLMPVILEGADLQDPTPLVLQFGRQSPVYQPARDIMVNAIRRQYEMGASTAVDEATVQVVELCFDAAVANHVLGLTEGDPGWMQPGLLDDLASEQNPVAPSPPVATALDAEADQTIAELENSAGASANDELHVARQIVDALHSDNTELLATWAEFPMPGGFEGALDLDSLSCDRGICTVFMTDGRRVDIVLQYADRGWYGIEVMIDFTSVARESSGGP